METVSRNINIPEGGSPEPSKKLGTVIQKNITAFQYWHDKCQKTLRISEEYQRQTVWDKKKQSQLIESMICGFAVPSILIWENPLAWWVQDGGQRSRAIWEFRDDTLKLTGLSYRKDLENKIHSQLSNEDKRAFDKYELILEICQNVPIEVIAENVKRRNKGGIDMNAMEILNFRIDSDFLRLVRKLSGATVFKNLVGDVNPKRMDDRKLALRCLFAIQEFLNVRRKDTLWNMLTAYADKMDKSSIQEYQNLEKHFYDVVDTATLVFGKNAPFREKTKKKVHEGIFQAVMTSMALYDKKELIDARVEIRKALEDLIASHDTYEVPSGKRVKFMTWVDLAAKDGWSRLHRLYEIWSKKLDEAIIRASSGKVSEPVAVLVQN
jgi:hypothetical protein